MAPEDTLSEDENKQIKNGAQAVLNSVPFVVASDQFSTDIKKLCHEDNAVLGQFCPVGIA